MYMRVKERRNASELTCVKAVEERKEVGALILGVSVGVIDAGVEDRAEAD